ncbi:MAG: hypothetical protein P4L80_07305 [Xanthobacteraceae bacterium]|nr:hypothetical protein [Xanthobacteraceae bacterium]
MDARTYFTVSSVVGILYALGFLLIPGNMVLMFGGPPEAHVILNLQFCGAGLLAWGVISWFARDFRDWGAVRGVLIGNVVGDAVLVVLTVYAALTGLLNKLTWGSAIVVALLLLWGLYCLMAGARKTA